MFNIFPKLIFIICIAIYNSSAFITNSSSSNCEKQTQCSEVDLSIYNYTNSIVRSGYLSIPSKPKSALGFIFYGKTGVKDVKDLSKYPIILWLGGGPGMSTQANNFEQVGPLILQKIFSLKVKNNPYSWANNYNLLFVDQPIGTGLSCASKDSQIPQRMQSVAQQFYEALYQLYQTKNGCFSSSNLNLSPKQPFYIFGQSYGGKYAPAIASLIHRNSQTSQAFLTGLKGVSIIDGFANPVQIFSQTPNHAYHLGLLNLQQRIRAQKLLFKMYFHMEQNKWTQMKEDFFNTMAYIAERSGVSYYNINQTPQSSSLLQQYFGNPNILELFKFDKTLEFQAFTQKVEEVMSDDFMRSQLQDIQYLLNRNISFLIMQGQNDLIVSPSGTLRWIQKINFLGSAQFNKKSLIPWKVNSQILAFQKKYKNLTYKMVINAGHFVAKDAPKAAYYIAKEFIDQVK